MDIKEEIRRGIEMKESWSRRIVIRQSSLSSVIVKLTVDGGSLSIIITSRSGRIVYRDVITDWRQTRLVSSNLVEYLYQILDVDILIRLLNINPSIASYFYKSERGKGVLCCIVGSHCIYRKSSDHPFHAIPIRDNTIYLPHLIALSMATPSMLRHNKEIRVEVDKIEIIPHFYDINVVFI